MLHHGPHECLECAGNGYVTVARKRGGWVDRDGDVVSELCECNGSGRCYVELCRRCADDKSDYASLTEFMDLAVSHFGTLDAATQSILGVCRADNQHEVKS